jgi:hypothetical protein
MRLLPNRGFLACVAAFVLCGLVLGAPAPAPQKAKLKKSAGVSVNHQLLQELGQARHLLHLANHDYKGYRAKAVHEVTKAMHALEPNHKHHPHHPTVARTGGNNEAQDVSDKQLQQAIQILHQVRSQLGGARGGNTVAANEHIGHAIRELHTALKIN